MYTCHIFSQMEITLFFLSIENLNHKGCEQFLLEWKNSETFLECEVPSKLVLFKAEWCSYCHYCFWWIIDRFSEWGECEATILFAKLASVVVIYGSASRGSNGKVEETRGVKWKKARRTITKYHHATLPTLCTL